MKTKRCYISTLYYKAIKKIENDWIKENSISHTFSNGKGEVHLYDSVIEIGNMAFSNCTALTEITIPNSVTEIRSMCFYCCTNLKSVVISESVKKVGYLAFFNCQNLTTIIINGTDKNISDDAFSCCKNLSKESIDRLLLCKLGFYTFSELNSNFVDRGDYIECRKPIKGITMIQKGYSQNMNWNEAERYAKELRSGGFDDWQIPLIEELDILYNIKEICGIKQSTCFWSLSQKTLFEATNFDAYDYTFHLIFDFSCGKVIEKEYKVEKLFDDNPISCDEPKTDEDRGSYNVRCVRVVTEKMQNRIHDSYVD